MQRRLYIYKAHTALDTFQFVVFFICTQRLDDARTSVAMQWLFWLIEMLSKHPSSTKVKNNNCISSQMYSAGAYSTVSCLFSVSIKTGGGLMVWNYDMIPPIKFTDLSGPNFLDPILLCLWSRNHNFHLQTWVVGTGCTTHGGNTYNICLHF